MKIARNGENGFEILKFTQEQDYRAGARIATQESQTNQSIEYRIGLAQKRKISQKIELAGCGSDNRLVSWLLTYDGQTTKISTREDE